MRALLALVTVLAAVLAGSATVAQAQGPNGSLSPATVDPARDALLDHTPERVVVQFGEPLAEGQLTLFDEMGAVVASTNTVSDSADTLQIELASPADGTYLVSWSAESSEGAPGSGGSVFRIDSSGLDAVDARAVVSTDTDEPSAVRISLVVVQIAAWAGAIVLVGTWLVSLRSAPSQARRRLTSRLLWISWSVALGAALAGFAVEGLRGTSLGLADAFDPSLWRETADTWAGVAWLAAAIVLGLAAPAIAWATEDRTGTTRRAPQIVVGAGLSVALLVCLVIATPGLGGSDGSGSVSVSESTDTGSLELTLAPGEVGGNEIHLYLFDEAGLPTDPENATLRMRSLSSGVGPIDTALVRAGPNHFLSYDLPLPFAGDWEIEIVSTSSSGETDSAVATVEVS